MLDVEKIRADTPGVQEANHLLAAGSALMPQPVVDAIVEHIRLEARLGGYDAAAAAGPQLATIYQNVATLIGASAPEIAIVENATAAWCQAFYALPLGAGDRVLTCQAEYAANYVALLQRQKRDGIRIDVIPNDESGAVDVSALEAMLDERVALIAMTWMPTNGGLVNPAAAVGQVARKHEIPFLLDACQAVGQHPIDVAALGCDFLSATGRKFLRGPRGIGFLYVHSDWLPRLEPAMIDHFAAPWVSANEYALRDDARRFENWENAYALRAGLNASITYALGIGIEHIQERAWALAAGLRSQLSSLPGARVHDAGREHSAIVGFSIAGLDPSETVQGLRQRGIKIGTSDPGSTRLDAEARGLPLLFRAAPHYYNTEGEIDALVNGLRDALQRR